MDFTNEDGQTPTRGGKDKIFGGDNNSGTVLIFGGADDD